MKLLLILPGVGKRKNTPYINTWQMEPLMISQIAAITPDDIEIKFYDDRVEEINFEEDADLVAITVETYTAKRAYFISSKFRKRGIPVIMGGFHPTLVPNECAKYADSIVIGEVEGVWNNLINDVKNNNLKPFYQKILTSFPKGIMPKRAIYNDKKYLPVCLIESARGCPYNCEFCSVTNFYNHNYKIRPIDDFIKDMKTSGKKTFFIVDDNIVADIKRTKELLRAMIPLNIIWAGQGSIHVAEDEELLYLLKKSGCKMLLIGFESLNKKALNKMNKKWNLTIGEYDKLIANIYKYDIGIYATFVFGYGDEDEETFKNTYKFALKNKFLFGTFNHLLPFPGTPLYERLKKENKLLYKKWWLKDNYKYGDISFKPDKLSPEELRDLCVKYRRKFFSTSSILKRALNFRGNLKSPSFAMIYFVQNFLQQKEVEMKFGMPIGDGLDE